MVIRPGQLHPNELETAILKRIAADNPVAQLSTQKLHVLSRKFTGVGSFTEFLLKNSSNTLARTTISLAGTISIPGLQYGLGAVAFFEGDELKTLETHTYGDEKWDGVFDGFTTA